MINLAVRNKESWCINVENLEIVIMTSLPRHRCSPDVNPASKTIKYKFVIRIWIQKKSLWQLLLHGMMFKFVSETKCWLIFFRFREQTSPYYEPDLVNYSVTFDLSVVYKEFLSWNIFSALYLTLFRSSWYLYVIVY